MESITIEMVIKFIWDHLNDYTRLQLLIMITPLPGWYVLDLLLEDDGRLTSVIMKIITLKPMIPASSLI